MCKNGRIWRWVDHTVGHSTLSELFANLVEYGMCNVYVYMYNMYVYVQCSCMFICAYMHVRMLACVHAILHTCNMSMVIMNMFDIWCRNDCGNISCYRLSI